MVNKDYILRLAEAFGRELSIVLGLRKKNKQEEALLYIDNLLLSRTGLTSRFINVMSEEMLVKTLSPLGRLNIEACLWIASMLKVEGEIYEELGNRNESYYRYQKSLYLLLEAWRNQPMDEDSTFLVDIRELFDKLAEYELPAHIQRQLLFYYEQLGQYSKTEDLFFELLENMPDDASLRTLGRDFYTRLLTKSTADLQAGNLSREEVHEGLAQLQ